MVYLQDSNRGSRLAALDSSGVRLLPALRSRLLKRTTARNVSGQRGDIAGRPAAVYVAGGRLWLAIDNQPWFLDEIEATVTSAVHGYVVQIVTPAKSYEFPADRMIDDGDSTAFASPEDFSFGLWTARIVNDPERQKVLLEVLVDASLDDVPEHARTEGRGRARDVRGAWTSHAATSDPHDIKRRPTE